MSRHQVQKQTFEIRVPRQEDARSLQDRLSTFGNHKLPIILDEIFEKQTAGTDRAWRIDRLEIDLGHLSEKALESQLTESIRRKLTKALEKYRQSQERSGQKSDQPTERLSLQQRSLESLQYYLKHGVLPWWSEKPPPWMESQHLAQLLQRPDTLIKTLSVVINESPPALERLMQHIPPALIAGIIEHGVPAGEAQSIRKLAAKATWTSGDTEKLLFLIALSRSRAENRETAAAIIARHFSRQALLGLYETLVRRIGRRATETTPHWQQSLATLLQQATGSQSDTGKPKPPAPEANAENRSKAGHKRTESHADFKLRRPSKTPDESEAIALIQLTDRIDETIQESGDTNKASDTQVYVESAGIILLSPFLLPLFEGTGLVVDKSFVNAQARHQAVYLLEYLVWEENQHVEYDLALEKCLCGIPTEVPLISNSPTDEQKGECNILLKATIDHWKALKSTSPDGLREAFLQREGRLEPKANPPRLRVNPMPQDMLLQRLPWSYSIIKLPWMDQRLHVEWG
ncbi:MAG: hypothetical protein OI74_01845 [Gammaproteobacteria bacterium (ex Lamellibrachia satsuma)]|nr:MAG: hypothetical protein HPY30_07035 [Gammaproteobacteria bacterium (ex Lamellibrachia satsuma)]RRS33089.1 MAG: hypothetical protein NV67_17000 [Gammaproteobacteria bacterium (ex Lamellibrachia satsuma)]RRS35514.1 MAG: hypothetical protein OI74_01845 [Gammaproteobacteria bacterium (ex Lamellibrachia satsuma)]